MTSSLRKFIKERVYSIPLIRPLIRSLYSSLVNFELTVARARDLFSPAPGAAKKYQNVTAVIKSFE